MKNKLVAGFMAATMMVSVMSTGVFAKELNPDTLNFYTKIVDVHAQ